MGEKSVKEKSLALAIGLNFLLPGLGYIYMGRWVIGILGGLAVIVIFVSTGLIFIVPTWIGVNVIMAIDMILLSKKNDKKLADGALKKCPNCAEMIQREAKICRFCRTKFDIV